MLNIFSRLHVCDLGGFKSNTPDTNCHQQYIMVIIMCPNYIWTSFLSHRFCPAVSFWCILSAVALARFNCLYFCNFWDFIIYSFLFSVVVHFASDLDLPCFIILFCFLLLLLSLCVPVFLCKKRREHSTTMYTVPPMVGFGTTISSRTCDSSFKLIVIKRCNTSLTRR